MWKACRPSFNKNTDFCDHDSTTNAKRTSVTASKMCCPTNILKLLWLVAHAGLKKKQRLQTKVVYRCPLWDVWSWKSGLVLATRYVTALLSTSFSVWHLLMVVVSKQWPSAECNRTGSASYLSDRILFLEHWALSKVIIWTRTEASFMHCNVSQ